MMKILMQAWFLYAWWLVVNSVMYYLAFDFLLKMTGAGGRRYVPVWLGIGGAMTLCAVHFQIPGMFLLYILLVVIFGKQVLNISWVSLSAPAAILFTLHTLIEGISAVILSFLSSNAELGDYGIIVQMFASLAAAGLFFLLLFLIQKRYACALRQSLSSYLYVLLLPCAVFVLAIRWGLKLDSPVFAAHLSAFGPDASLTVLLIMIGAAGIFFLILEVFCKIVSMSGHERTSALLREQLEGQRIYVEEARKRNEAYASFQHDIDNHLLVLSGLLREQRYEEAGRFAEKLHESHAPLSLSPSTGRPVLDVLLREKISYAKRSGIAVSWDVRIPKSFHGEDLDLCVVFANIIDNGITACAAAKQERPFLSIVTRNRGKLLVIESRNNADVCEGQEIEFGTGLNNIRAVAEQYQGTMALETGDGIFQISVLLCSG